MGSPWPLPEVAPGESPTEVATRRRGTASHSAGQLPARFPAQKRATQGWALSFALDRNLEEYRAQQPRLQARSTQHVPLAVPANSTVPVVPAQPARPARQLGEGL